MKRTLLSLSWFLIFAVFANSVALAKTTICNGPYALCAYAKCMPIPGKKGKTLCTCETKSGYSIGNKACVTQSKFILNGYKMLESRYYPVKKFVSCHNNRAWANCYNSKCIINPRNNSQAFCTCKMARNKGDYMFATDSCSTSGCESGIISSYVVKDAISDLESLKTVSNYDKLPTYTPQLCSIKSKPTH